jgi:hypothetical protein
MSFQIFGIFMAYQSEMSNEAEIVNFTCTILITASEHLNSDIAFKLSLLLIIYEVNETTP